MIWFFGFTLIKQTDELIFYFTHDNIPSNEYYPDVTVAVSIMILCIQIIPLIFMKDDNDNKK